MPQQWDELVHQWEFTDKYTLVPFLEFNHFGENLLDVACIFPLTSSSCTECSITLSQGRRNVFMNLFGNKWLPLGIAERDRALTTPPPFWAFLLADDNQ